MRKKKKKKEEEEDDKIQLFRRSVSQLPRSQRYVSEYFCELLGSIILCMLSLWFVASLATIWVIHNYGKFKISVAIPK